MDRGQGGNFVAELQRKNRFLVHRARIRNIMKRKPGSSKTLDNSRPVVINALIEDPRKVAVRQFAVANLERENKTLLKRIAKIITSPPAITDQDYQRMKRLVQRVDKNPKQRYENEIKKKAYDIYRARLKHVTGIYNVKEWEDDYQRQLELQRFSRQVQLKEKKVPTDLKNSGKHPESLVDEKIYERFYETGEYLEKPKMPSSQVHRVQSVSGSARSRPKSGGGYYYGGWLRRRATKRSEPVSPMKRLMKKGFTLSSAGFDQIEKERQSTYRDVYNVIEVAGPGYGAIQAKSGSLGVVGGSGGKAKKVKDKSDVNFNLNMLGDFGDEDSNEDEDVYDGLEAFSFDMGDEKDEVKPEVTKEDSSIELISTQRKVKLTIKNGDNANNPESNKSRFIRRLNRDITNAKIKQMYLVEGDLSCWYYFQSQTLVISVTTDLPNPNNSMKEPETDLGDARDTTAAGLVGEHSSGKSRKGKNHNDMNSAVVSEIVENWRKNNSNLEFIQAEIELPLVDLCSKLDLVLSDFALVENEPNEDSSKKLELIAVELLECIEILLDKSDAILTLNLDRDSGRDEAVNENSSNEDDQNIEVQDKVNGDDNETAKMGERVTKVNFADKLVEVHEGYTSHENSFDKLRYLAQGDSLDSRVLSINPSSEQLDAYLYEKESICSKSKLDIKLVIDNDSSMAGIQSVKFKRPFDNKSQNGLDDSFINFDELEQLNFDVTLTVSGDSKSIHVMLVANGSSKMLKRPKKLNREHHLSHSGHRIDTFTNLNDLLTSMQPPISPVHGSGEGFGSVQSRDSSPKKDSGSSATAVSKPKRLNSYTQIVDKGEVISATFNLPTIAAYDIEFTNEFISKLIENMVVVHAYDINSNSIILRQDLGDL